MVWIVTDRAYKGKLFEFETNKKGRQTFNGYIEGFCMQPDYDRDIFVVIGTFVLYREKLVEFDILEIYC